MLANLALVRIECCQKSWLAPTDHSGSQRIIASFTVKHAAQHDPILKHAYMWLNDRPSRSTTLMPDETASIIKLQIPYPQAVQLVTPVLFAQGSYGGRKQCSTLIARLRTSSSRCKSSMYKMPPCDCARSPGMNTAL